VYVPHSGHSLHAKAARIEILSWLNSHSSHPSMLVGILIYLLRNWVICSLNLVIGKFFTYGAPQFLGVEVIENLI